MKVDGPNDRTIDRPLSNGPSTFDGPSILPSSPFRSSISSDRIALTFVYPFYNHLFCSEVVRETGGYMTRDGVANLNRVEYVMRAIGRMEDSIFKKRREDECRRRIRDEKRKHQNKNHRQFGDKARNEGRNEVNDMF